MMNFLLLISFSLTLFFGTLLPSSEAKQHLMKVIDTKDLRSDVKTITLQKVFKKNRPFKITPPEVVKISPIGIPVPFAYYAVSGINENGKSIELTLLDNSTPTHLLAKYSQKNALFWVSDPIKMESHEIYEHPTDDAVIFAAGLGITPYRPLIKELIKKNHRGNITLFYSVKNSEQIIFRSFLNKMASHSNVHIFISFTGEDALNDSSLHPQITQSFGRFNEGKNRSLIQEQIKASKKEKTHFYYSNPPESFAEGMKDIVKEVYEI